jgi:hypothetical protein
MTLSWTRGPWWCASCGRVFENALVPDGGGPPSCTYCGTALELQGEGDDDPGED